MRVVDEASSERPGDLRSGMREGVPFIVALTVVAVSFGVAARPVLGVAAPIVMSAVMYAGAAQFAATAVLAAGGDAAAAIAAGILANLRLGPMGVAIAPSLEGGPVRRAAISMAIVDPFWAMARHERGFHPLRMVGASLPTYPLWVGGTALGVLAGGAIGDTARFGLDAVFPAFFLALLVRSELPRGRLSVVVAVLGAAIALALAPWAPPGVPVVAGCLAALLGAFRR